MTAHVRLPLRRSALDSLHDALGARWVSDDVRWPESYGDRDAEAEAVRLGVAMSEIGPFDKLVLRGSPVGPALGFLGVSSEPGRIARVGTLEAWVLGLDEALVLLDPLGDADRRIDVVAERVRAAGAIATDVSSGTTALRLLGPRARSVLEALTAVDVSERSFGPSAIVAAPVAAVRALIGRQDRDGVPGFTLLVDRDVARYLWESLLEAGASHRIVPVGGAAARPTPLEHATPRPAP